MKELPIGIKLESVMTRAIFPLYSCKCRIVRTGAAHPLPFYLGLEWIAMVRKYHERVI